MDQTRYTHDTKNESSTHSSNSNSASTIRVVAGGGGILRQRPPIRTTRSDQSHIFHEPILYPLEQGMEGDVKEFISPNQEFTEYMLCFLLRKIALVFYFVFTIIDSILSCVVTVWPYLSVMKGCRSRNTPLSATSKDCDNKGSSSSCRSRTCTEETVSTSSTHTVGIMESPKTWFSYPSSSSTKQYWTRGDDNDEHDHHDGQQQQQKHHHQQQWGHFTFLE